MFGPHKPIQLPFFSMDGRSHCLPDFTIDDQAMGRTILWEHCGMLADEGYRERRENKLRWYRENGVPQAQACCDHDSVAGVNLHRRHYGETRIQNWRAHQPRDECNSQAHITPHGLQQTAQHAADSRHASIEQREPGGIHPNQYATQQRRPGRVKGFQSIVIRCFLRDNKYGTSAPGFPELPGWPRCRRCACPGGAC